MQHDKPYQSGADEDKTEQADDHGEFFTGEHRQNKKGWESTISLSSAFGSGAEGDAPDHRRP
ncbi:MAG: hypothetical protein ACOYJ6_07690 [Caulobacterales bacterium]